MGFGLYNPGQDEIIQELLEETFTIRIEGTRDISGFTNRQATVSEIRAVVSTDRGQEERIFRAAVDHLSANALYFRIDSDFLDADFPLFATYFSRTPQAYTESAFDVYLSSLITLCYIRNISRRAFSGIFPCWSAKSGLSLRPKRHQHFGLSAVCTDADVSITVPAGSYNNAYLVEEEIVGLPQLPALKLSEDFQTLEVANYEPAKYWVVPNVGVVKYQYPYILTETELANGAVVNIIVSGDFELGQFELPDDNSR